MQASGSKAPTVVASKGVKPRKMEDEHQHGHMVIDPHAWQSIANAKIYVANIREALKKADPAGRERLPGQRQRLSRKLDALETEVKAAIEKIPADRRKIITTHDAFGYFGAAYGMEFIAPEGVSTNSEPSAKDVAKIITQVEAAENPCGVHGEHLRSTPDASGSPMRPAPRSAARSIPTRCPNRAARPAATSA